MKKFRKLIPALCMLLISAMLMGTSTYAWFSMNTTVTAGGMQVTASTSKNLVISTNSNVNNNEGVSMNSTFSGCKVLAPASVQTLAGSANFFKVSNGKITYSNGAMENGATTVSVKPFTSGESGEVAKHTFYIRVDGSDSEKFDKLYVKTITLSSSASAITKALRVGVTCGSNGYIYAPAYTPDAYYGVIKAGTKSDSEKLISDTAVTVTTAGSATATLGEVTTAYSTIDVYIWYEGQDPNCTSANSVNVEQITISIEFIGEMNSSI